MSIGDELMERLGDHATHTRDVRRSPLTIYHGIDTYNGPIYKPPSKFRYRYELRNCRKVDILKQPLTKDILEYQASLINPIEIWSDPDTNDQICRLLLELEDGSYDHSKMNTRMIRLGRANIYDLKQRGGRYKKAGIFYRCEDSLSNIRLVNYLLPFSIDPPDDMIDFDLDDQ